jgi:uncharacterized membrane protein
MQIPLGIALLVLSACIFYSFVLNLGFVFSFFGNWSAGSFKLGLTILLSFVLTMLAIWFEWFRYHVNPYWYAAITGFCMWWVSENIRFNLSQHNEQKSFLLYARLLTTFVIYTGLCVAATYLLIAFFNFSLSIASPFD